MKTLLISFVLIAVICLTNGISVAAPPPEIAKHFSGHGVVHSVHQILSDSDLKHIAVVQHGSLFAIVYAVYADNMGGSPRTTS